MLTYIQTLNTQLATGKATEHTYRPALQNLLECEWPNCTIINEPKRLELNAVDFEIHQGDIPIGWIETKDINTDLDKVQNSEQLIRYRDSLYNLILTNYIEFRYFANGALRPELTVRIAKLDGQLNLRPLPNNFTALHQLLAIFRNSQIPTLNNPRDLAERMAKFARIIAFHIYHGYEAEKTANEFLHRQLESFRRVLIDTLQITEFADMYAQTICYGLFAAKCTLLNEKLSRYNAAHSISRTNPFLRNLFDQMAGINMDTRLILDVDNLIALLNYADINAILADFGKHTRREDPIVHFYETFLAAYNPALREVRGVYYTPEPIVSYIIRSIDSVLKDRFNLPDGLACRDKLASGLHKVQILDPATGTGTFLYALLQLIYEKFWDKKGLWSTYVHEHLLPRLHGFELLMAPYTVAHMKLGLLLNETGYEFANNERLHVFLTNALEQFDTHTESLLAQWLADEANAARMIKNDTPVMVILGNPPYSGHSVNPSKRGQELTFIGEQLLDYFQVDGKSLGEKNPKWLQDDYVKFIRFAQWRINQTGYGVLGFITNHGYLDNPTFRGMRQSLMQDFDEIFILDLHGNAKKKEQTPDGTVDKNVFDIQQGVAIGIFIKYQPKPLKKGIKTATKITTNARVFHSELWGERANKYAWLNEQYLKTTDWVELKPDTPFYLFKPQNIDLLDEYNAGWKITEMMPVNSVGIVTARDSLTIQNTSDSVLRIVEDFASLDIEMARHKYLLRDDTRDWKVKLAQDDLKKDGIKKSSVMPILYRPFDIRYTYYTGKCRGFICKPRQAIMEHLLLVDNIALIATRQTSILGWQHIFISNIITESCVVSNKTKEINYLFPLYLYPQNGHNHNGNGTLDIATNRKVNFAPKFIHELENKLQLKFVPELNKNDNITAIDSISPEDVFHYMYAIFHSPIYRNRYAEFLKMDFPRLPLTSDRKLFFNLAVIGEQLAQIHLMQAQLSKAVGYPIVGNNVVEKIEYKHGQVYINKTQYFAPVQSTIWELHIGGYQVAQKWLKDRKGQSLNYDDLEHYLYILAALDKTMELMEQIDAIIPELVTQLK